MDEWPEGPQTIGLFGGVGVAKPVILYVAYLVYTGKRSHAE